MAKVTGRPPGEVFAGGLRRERVATLVATANVVIFSALVAEQAVEWEDQFDPGRLVWWVGGVTLVVGLVLVVVVVAVSRLLRSWLWRGAIALVLVVFQALVRTALLLPVISAARVAGPEATVAWATGVIGYGGALAAGFLVAWLLQREDAERARRVAQEARTTMAVRELETEELRVRQLVADQLHGTIQQQLVIISAGLARLAGELEEPARSRWGPALQEWAEELDVLREEDVRALSHTLFPPGADLGIRAAIHMLIDRLPPSVMASMAFGPTLQDLDESDLVNLPLPDRLVVVYAVEEAVTNALKHGGANSVSIHAEAQPSSSGDDRWVLDLVVDDNGRGPSEDRPHFSGLERHRVRARTRGGDLTLAKNSTGGARLHLVLPFTTGQDERTT